ncbi:MAG: phosphoribosylformylglycinamidine cyclo-ligase [Candidatus Omnitrophica bacterium]|nr:phosphoribosylformylglycinamidine cyclo-ligase [Candidatus Omnitrophota bacterium]
MTSTLTYKRAGVDVEAADRFVDRIKPLVASTRRPEVVSGLNQFGGLFALKQYRRPLLVASADGVGTKLKLAQLVGRYDTIGIDAVAMNVNDILCFGAEPLFFLDYLACGKLAPSAMTAIVRGMAKGCREAGCALLGGETAEMPGVYQPGEYDIAGFALGVVEKSRLIDGRSVRRGDVIIGLASSGVHSNGFALVHRVFSTAQLRRHAAELLRPTRIYVRPVLDVARHVKVKALAHVTGGGLARRLPSLVSRAKAGLRIYLDRSAWRMPEVFRRIQRTGRLTPSEVERTFNCGIGMALVCRPKDVERVQGILRKHHVNSWVIGHVV